MYVYINHHGIEELSKFIQDLAFKRGYKWVDSQKSEFFFSKGYKYILFKDRYIYHSNNDNSNNCLRKIDAFTQIKEVIEFFGADKEIVIGDKTLVLHQDGGISVGNEKISKESVELVLKERKELLA